MDAIRILLSQVLSRIHAYPHIIPEERNLLMKQIHKVRGLGASGYPLFES